MFNADVFGEVISGKKKRKIEKIIKNISFLLRLGEKLAVSFLYSMYYSKSTFLEDKLNDYFLGGLDDMATVRRANYFTTSPILLRLFNLF